MTSSTKRIWHNLPYFCVLTLFLSLMSTELLRRAPIPPFFPDYFEGLRDNLIDLTLSKSFQGCVLGILFLNHLLLLWLNRSQKSPNYGCNQSWWRAWDAGDGCKLFLALCAVWHYVAEWKAFPDSGDKGLFLFGTDQSTNALVFLGGIVFGQYVQALVPRNTRGRLLFERISFIVIAVFLAAVSLVPNTWADPFQYRGGMRATGLWNNPNTYGLLMGTGLILALCFLMQCAGWEQKNQAGIRPGLENDLQHGGKEPEREQLPLVAMVLGVVVMLLLLNGLIHSLSRGAWLATLGGCVILFSSPFRRQGNKPGSWIELKINASLAWLHKERWPLIIGGCAAIALFLMGYSHTGPRLTRRAASVVNANDFSWRNRVIADKGALEVMTDHSMIGVGWYRASAGMGWHHASPEFDELYAPPILAESWSIILNDYLMLGMILGIPALVSFIYLAIASWNKAARAHNVLIGCACRGVLTVFLIGFWFDGGLFKLTVAIPFWFFLELCNSTAEESP